MQIAKIRGIAIKLHYSTLVIVGLVGLSAAQFYSDVSGGAVPLSELVFVGLASGFILLFSILLHELMHSFAAQHYGLTITEIEMYLFGGVSKLHDEPKSPKQEFLIAFVGPLTSIVLGVVFFLLRSLNLSIDASIDAIFWYAGLSNIVLGVFNLLPAYPMDGGRLVRAVLWRKRGDLLSATKSAAKAGEFFGGMLIFFGIMEVFVFAAVDGIWLVVMGLFLRSAARNSVGATIIMSKLRGSTAQDMMSTPFMTIPTNVSLADAKETYFKHSKMPYLFVENEDGLIGVMFAEDYRKLNPMSLKDLGVLTLVQPFNMLSQVSAETDADKILSIFSDQDKPRKSVLIVNSPLTGKPIGIIGPRELDFFINYN